MADKIRKSQLLRDSPVTSFACPLYSTIPQVINSTTPVRTAVARSELTSFNPALANIAVRAAKTADNNAYASQDGIFSICPKDRGKVTNGSERASGSLSEGQTLAVGRNWTTFPQRSIATILQQDKRRPLLPVRPPPVEGRPHAAIGQQNIRPPIPIHIPYIHADPSPHLGTRHRIPLKIQPFRT